MWLRAKLAAPFVAAIMLMAITGCGGDDDTTAGSDGSATSPAPITTEVQATTDPAPTESSTAGPPPSTDSPGEAPPPAEDLDLSSLDPCVLFDQAGAEAILGRAVQSIEPEEILGGAGIKCKWDAGFVDDANGGSYRVLLTVDFFPGPIEGIGGEGCTQEPVADLGDKAVSLRCAPPDSGWPESQVLFVETGGVTVGLHINPDRAVSFGEARTEMERILASL